MAQILVGLGNKCLDIAGSKIKNGSKIILWKAHHWPNQQWKLSQEGYLTSPLDPTKCLQVEDSKTVNGTKIVLWDKEDTPNQKWTYDSLLGYFTSALDETKCISVQNDENKNGAAIVLWEKQAKAGQSWYFKPASEVMPASFTYYSDAKLAENWKYQVFKGRGLQSLSIHYPKFKINSNPVLSGSFNKGIPLQFRVHTKMSLAAFQEKIMTYAQQGYVLRHISIFSTMKIVSKKIGFFKTKVPQQVDVFYSGIWRKKEKNEMTFEFPKIPNSEFRSYWSKYVGKQKYAVEEHISYEDAGKIYHALVMSNRPKKGFYLLHGLNMESMFDKNQAYEKKGFHLVSFHVFEYKKQLRFGGIWERTGKFSLFLPEMTVSQFKKRCRELEPLGYTLQKVQVYAHRFKEKYAAIWSKTGTVAFNSKFPKVKQISLINYGAKTRWEGAVLVNNDNRKNVSVLPWNGSTSDKRGFVRSISTHMEDRRTHRVLQMHPRWINKGTINGRLPAIKLPKQAYLVSKVGFINGAVNTDGVTFQVWAHVGSTKSKIKVAWKKYNKRLQTFYADLSHLEGKSVVIELRVDAGESSGQDWAAWVNPRIIGFEYVSNNVFLEAHILRPQILNPQVLDPQVLNPPILNPNIVVVKPNIGIIKPG